MGAWATSLALTSLVYCPTSPQTLLGFHRCFFDPKRLETSSPLNPYMPKYLNVDFFESILISYLFQLM